MANNEIAIRDRMFDLDSIRQTVDLRDLIKKVNKINALGEALKANETFHEMSVQYAQLEAEALVRVAELDGIEQLRRKEQRAVAKWLYEMGEKERNHYIRMCSQGLTIDQVYKREIGDKLAEEEKDEIVNKLRSRLIEELKVTGQVNMESFNTSVSSLYPRSAKKANAIIDDTRKDLRRAGGICVAEGSKTYLMAAKNGNPEGSKSAIRYRAQKMNEDFHSIINIIAQCGVEMEYEEILGALCGYSTEKQFVNEPFWLHIMFALAEYGAFSNSEKMMDAITDNSGESLYKLFRENPEFGRFIEKAYSSLENYRKIERIA